MKRYYLNNHPQVDGTHEVHSEDCFYLQFVYSKRDLGYHINCQSAVDSARKIYPTADGCRICSEECFSG